MRIEDGVVYFENLVRADQTMIGGTQPVCAKISAAEHFTNKNAKGHLREVKDLFEIERIAQETATNLGNRFQAK
jgi:hypothetical protein